MKCLLLALLSLIVIAQADEKKKVPLKEYGDEKALIGKLGVPFGTFVRVTCRSFEPTDKERRIMGEPWKLQVEIISIQGKPVEPAIRIDWGTLIPKAVPKPPVGETIEVWAYESGSFAGLPDDLWKYEDNPPQDRGFAFVNQLVAIRKVEPEDEK